MVMAILKLALALFGLGAASASQWPVFDEPFEPTRALNAMSADAYTHFSHPLYPDYDVRVKRTDWCDHTVNAYTGYFDLGARHLFFYFFESRSEPDRDDVVLFTHGGPGCSALLGLLFEHGPCRVINSTKGPEFFEHSWNSNANVLYLDQPDHTGFSYAEHGETVYTTEEAAEDVARAVFLFFESFSQYKGRSFHMAGISYGGRYIPVFASAVHDQNALLAAQGLTPVNLTSITIGNGNTDMSALWQGAYELVCTSTAVTPVLPIRECIHMKHEVQQCRQQMKEHCEDRFDLESCREAFYWCDTAIMDPYRKTGLNIYDISRPCEGGLENLCYPVTTEITSYLSRSDVRTFLGVDAQVPEEYALCNMSVGMGFHASGDALRYRSSAEYVGALLERGVRVLVYAGTYDLVCNSIGNSDLVLNLEWSGKKAFNDAPLREWWAVGEKAGVTRSAKGLTFATIDCAGHMAAHDKPEQVLAMLNRWLAAVDL